MSNQSRDGIIEIILDQTNVTWRQHWSHILVMLLTLSGLFIGYSLKNSIINATATYIDREAGITAEYPQNWLIDTEGEYVFRVRNVTQPGFKTSIQVAARPVSDETQARNILDALSLSRSQSFAAYSILDREAITLSSDDEALSLRFTFVATETNPFLQSTPYIVTGLDVLVIKRGQAIIITFLSEQSTFETNLNFLNQFLDNLEF